jgi:hypothetical protein
MRVFGRSMACAVCVLIASAVLVPAATDPGETLYQEGVQLLNEGKPEAGLKKLTAAVDALGRSAAETGSRKPEAPLALEAAASCWRLLGDPYAGAALDVRLLTEFATSPASARARVRLARFSATWGERSLAPRFLEDRTAGPIDADTAAAGRALSELLKRAAGDTPETPGTRAFDAVVDASEVRALSGLAVTAVGDIAALDADTGTIYRASAGETQMRAAPGAVARDASAPRPRGLAIDVRSGTWIWDEKGITPPDGVRLEPRTPAREGAPAEALKRIGAVAPGAMGMLNVLDTSAHRVLRYGPGLVPRDELAFPGRPTAIVCDADGTCYVLLETLKEVRVLQPGENGHSAPSGQEPRESVRGLRKPSLELKGEGWEIRSPVAIAVDALGRVYVLDDEARSVTVLDADGHRVATIAPAKGSAGELRAPVAVAVDGEGRVYVADRKQKRIVRYR